MEGRYPNGLLLAITSCNDPSKTEEFNYWYNHGHVPYVTAPGVFRHAIRFANTDSTSDVGQYVATYETNLDDVTRAMPAYREARAKMRESEDRSTPLMQSRTVGVFKRLGGEFSAANKPTLGILLVLSNCKDPAREEDFNRWYEEVHIPDILDAGGFHTAYRYESLDPAATKAKYMAIYETDNIDPANAREKHAEENTHWRERGRTSDLLDVTASLTARRIWPMD
jgi:hypothetical protein